MTVTDAAIDRIKQMIVAGELQPGDRLPREADLADRLGLSRNSLREAVRALSHIRVLDVRQGDGTYVTSLDPSLLLEAIGFVVDFHRDDTVLAILEVRRILEPAATALAAVLMSDDDVAALREHLAAVDEDAGVDELIENDLEFHRRIAAGSANAVLSSLLEGLSAPMQRARVWRGITQQSATERTLSEHWAILDAISGRRPEVARAWATVHIAGVEEWLRGALAE